MALVPASSRGAGAPSGAAGGDLGGTYPNPTVDLMAGGTITGLLNATPTSTTADDIFKAVAPTGYEAGSNIGAFYRAIAEDGTTVLLVDTYGDFTFAAPAGQGGAIIRIKSTDVSGNEVDLSTSTGIALRQAGSDVFRVNANGSILTAPPASEAATLALGTAYQHSTTRDVLLVVYLSVTVNTSGVLKLGVGPTNTPTQQTLVTGITSTGLWPVPIYLPASYFALLSVTGTITVAVDGQVAMPV